LPQLSAVSEHRVAFVGSVRCVRGAAPLGLILAGTLRTHPREAASLAFAGAAPADCPEALQDAEVERVAPGFYELRSGGRRWQIAASATHLHRRVAQAFYAALPPKPVPLGKRLFWRAVLALAASGAGLKLLRALRR